MKCSDAERLFDAFLDKQLSGTLRLELDAHRLRCRQCQQTLAMLESCGDVIASDRRGPLLGDDFAERVMADIADRQDSRMKIYRFRATRVAAVVGTLIPAAAVLMIAVIMSNPDDVATPIVVPPPNALIITSDVDMSRLRDLLYEQVEQGALTTTHITDSVKRTMMYLNMEVGGAVAAASAQQRNRGLFGILDLMLPAAPTETTEPSDEGSTQFSL